MLRRLLLACLFLLPVLSALAASDFLPPEKAFRFSARALDGHTLEIRYDIAKGYYLYKERFKFAVEPAGAKLGAPAFPVGIPKDDEMFGRVEIFHDELLIKLPIEGATGKFALKVTSQGCAEAGICYPPHTQSADIDFADVPSSGGGGDESSRVANLLHQASLWLVLLSFFGFGLLLAGTPCVFPMIPILSGIIAGHGHHISKSRAFGLSSVYVVAMALTYALAGVAAGLSGTLLSNALQNPWILGGFAAVFVVLSLSMFGFYELQMPSFLQSKLSETSSHQHGGSLTGVAIMGTLSALIVGPCVAAPLAGALLYIAKTRNAFLGGAALFTMGLGMGTPLILVGVFTRGLLPHAGPWMEAVKKFFGVLMLGVAIWLVSPVIPAAAHMLAWAALLIFSAIYLHALDPLPSTAHGWQRFWKGLGVVALVLGACMLIGVLAGSRDPLQPLAVLRSANAASQSGLKFEKVASVAELDSRLKTAGRPVMLDFYADWCVSCKEMERYSFTDGAVQAKLKDVLLLQADVTGNTPSDEALLKRFSLFGPPGIIFFDKSGLENSEIRVIGFQPADEFLATLRRAYPAR